MGNHGSYSDSLAIDEIAVEGELSDEGIHLAQGERGRRESFEVDADEAVAGRAQFECGLGGRIDDGQAVLSGQSQDAQDATYTRFTIAAVDLVAQGADVGAGAVGALQQAFGAPWRARGTILVLDAVPASVGAQVFAQELVGLSRVQHAHVQFVPLDMHLLADPAGWCAVVGAVDLDAAVQVHRALAVAVVAKRFERQRAQLGLLLGKHERHLTLGGAVDARVRPAFFPAIQIGLRLLQALEAQSLERLLSVGHACLDLAFAIGVGHAARQGQRAVVRQHVAVERVQLRVVHVGLEHAFTKVVEDHHTHAAAQAPESVLVQFGPDLRVRAPHQQAYRLARVAQGQHEQTRPPVLARARVANHRPFAVIHLCFVPGSRGDHHTRLDRRGAVELLHEALHARVTSSETVVVHQVLPDGHGVAPARQSLHDHLAEGLTGARTRRPPGRRRPGGTRGLGGNPARDGRRGGQGVGGHPLRGNGRF